MTVKNIRLKSGKSFRAPSIFLNPETEPEGQIIQQTNATYPNTQGGVGLEHIDGIVVYAKDWKNVSQGLKLDQTSFGNGRSIQDRVLLIVPELDHLFRGTEVERKRMHDTGLFNTGLVDLVNRIVETDPNDTNGRNDAIINEAYPLIDTRTIAGLLRYQLDNKASMLVMPAVPITASRQADRQFEKAQTMIKESNTILENVFTASHNKIDTMNLLTLNASLIKPENYNKITNVLLESSPSQVGIRITNFNPSNDNQVISVFNAIAELYNTIKDTRKDIPIHLMNMDHMSYFAWTYGASAVTMPIVRDPTFFGRRGAGQPVKPSKGVYYNTEDRTFDTFDVLYRKTRDANYKLPCYCEICQRYGTIPKVPESYWNDFRRIHTILVRSIELKMLREAPAPMNVSLKEMFLRSKKMGWTQFLPDRPIIAF
jgi:hypothetical protein